MITRWFWKDVIERRVWGIFPKYKRIWTNVVFDEEKCQLLIKRRKNDNSLVLERMSKLTLREFYYMEATGEYLPHEEIGKLVKKSLDKKEREEHEK